MSEEKESNLDDLYVVIHNHYKIIEKRLENLEKNYVKDNLYLDVQLKKIYMFIDRIRNGEKNQ